jgi:hypothetical protein
VILVLCLRKPATRLSLTSFKVFPVLSEKLLYDLQTASEATDGRLKALFLVAFSLVPISLLACIQGVLEA